MGEVGTPMVQAVSAPTFEQRSTNTKILTLAFVQLHRSYKETTKGTPRAFGETTS